MSKYPDFPLEEYELRYTRARAMMEESNIDALLITDELNYIYFTGHRSQLNPIDKLRPFVFVLPREEDCAMVIPSFEVNQARDTTWVTDIRPAKPKENVSTVASVLKDKGLANALIGAELGREQYLGIAYDEFVGIQNALPKANFVDAAEIILKLRGTKSPREVEYIRKSAEITARALDESLNVIHSGMTEIEVMHVLRELLAKFGGEQVEIVTVVSGATPKSNKINLPTGRKLQVGDTVVLDTGVEYRGYCCDVARTAYVGDPPPEVEEFYSWVMEVRQKSIDLLRSGNTPHDVVSAAQEAIAERGLATMRGVGRIGHGIGLAKTEYPSLSMDEDIVFEPGMVFTCNPNFVQDFGYFNPEDDWLITDGNPELLSSPMAPPKLPVIPVE